jgi:hypothetical protein
MDLLKGRLFLEPLSLPFPVAVAHKPYWLPELQGRSSDRHHEVVGSAPEGECCWWENLTSAASLKILDLFFV